MHEWVAGLPLLAVIDPEHVLDPEHGLNALLILGIALFGGTVGARIFQKIRVPQVVGYIAIGILVGESGFRVITKSVTDKLEPLNFFALGLIGFIIGGELRYDTFKKYGKQFLTILLAEGIGAFIVVGGITGVLAFLFTGSAPTSIALGLLLGAISSATAPADTVAVLWEYRTRGPLTTAILAIVALDDGLSLLLFGFASSIAGAITGDGQIGILEMIGTPIVEILGSLALGCAGGFLLQAILRSLREPDKVLAFAIGLVLLTGGLAQVLGLDLILAVMALGLTFANAAPRRSRMVFELIQQFIPPIYVLFFVFVGARLEIANMEGWAWTMAGAYVVGRSVGKMGGAYAGAVWSRASGVVRRYVGLCLFSQAGVAVGLSILANQRFPAEVGQPVLIIITATTFLVQFIGPPFVKYGVKKAGEIGLDVTEEDLIRSYNVSDVMEESPPVLAEETPLPLILKVFSETDQASYPVLDTQKRLLGLITIQEIREAIASEGFQELLVAYDLMEPVDHRTTPQTPLSEAIELMRVYRLEGLPVVRSVEEEELVGFLDARALNRALSEEILKRRNRAEAGAMA